MAIGAPGKYFGGPPFVVITAFMEGCDIVKPSACIQ